VTQAGVVEAVQLDQHGGAAAGRRMGQVQGRARFVADRAEQQGGLPVEVVDQVLDDGQ
jgi:hypothetical protein